MPGARYGGAFWRADHEAWPWSDKIQREYRAANGPHFPQLTGRKRRWSVSFDATLQLKGNNILTTLRSLEGQR